MLLLMRRQVWLYSCRIILGSKRSTGMFQRITDFRGRFCVSYTLKLRNIDPCNVTHSLISRYTRGCMFLDQISLLVVIYPPYITGFAINANHYESQLTPSHYVMCRYVECLFLFFFVLNCHLLNCWCMDPPCCTGRPKWEVDMWRWIMCYGIVHFPQFDLFQTLILILNLVFSLSRVLHISRQFHPPMQEVL